MSYNNIQCHQCSSTDNLSLIISNNEFGAIVGVNFVCGECRSKDENSNSASLKNVFMAGRNAGLSGGDAEHVWKEFIGSLPRGNTNKQSAPCPKCLSVDAEIHMIRKPAYIGVCHCGHRWEI